MTLNRCAALICAAWTATTSLSAMAWGGDGHKIVGLIAESFLTATTRSNVDALLASDTSGLVPSVGISDEATWADKYRDSDHSSPKQRYNQTHNWHFVDIEIGAPDIDAACFQHPPVPAGTPASAADPNDCVVDKINEFASELSDPSTNPAERLMALQFVLHFVGDMHQPLHSSDDHERGGKGKKVHGTGASSNLHSSWDTPFVTALGSGDANIAATLVSTITSQQKALWTQGSPSDWAMETFQLAKSDAYGKLPQPATDGSYALGADYVDNARLIVKQQLSKAGVRLAWVLN